MAMKRCACITYARLFLFDASEMARYAGIMRRRPDTAKVAQTLIIYAPR